MGGSVGHFPAVAADWMVEDGGGSVMTIGPKGSIVVSLSRSMFNVSLVVGGIGGVKSVDGTIVWI